jgi:hypothetical protein
MRPQPNPLAPFVLACLAFLLLSLYGGLTAQAQQVQVTAANPSSAAQGTVNLDVKITGKGFKSGAKAKFFVTNTSDPGGVTVNTTTFVSSTELTANITVSDTAVIANFDVQALNSDGRGGKGTELFAVLAKGADPVASNRSATLNLNATLEPMDGACNICPDSATTPTYFNGVDSAQAVFDDYGNFVFVSGARAVVFLYSPPLGDSLTTRTLPASDVRTQVRARTYKTSDTYTNLQGMSVGQAQCLGMGWVIGQYTDSERSVGFRYGRGVLSNTSFVVVTHPDDNTWVMEPAPQGACGTTFLQDNVARVRDSVTARGKTTDYDYGRYVMPFRLTLVRQ